MVYTSVWPSRGYSLLLIRPYLANSSKAITQRFGRRVALSTFVRPLPCSSSDNATKLRASPGGLSSRSSDLRPVIKIR